MFINNILILIISSIISILLNIKIIKQTNLLLNPFFVISVIFISFLFFSLFITPFFPSYPQIGICSIIYTSFFLIFVGALLVILLNFNSLRKRPLKIINSFSLKELRFVTDSLYLVFIISNIYYFYILEVNIGLFAIIESPLRWKIFSLSGLINEHSIYFSGRNLPFLGSCLTLVYLYSRSKNDLIKLIIYFLVSLINVRREPILLSISYLLVPLLIFYSKSIFILIKITIPFLLIFLAVFLGTLNSLTFGDFDFSTIISYTFGSFSMLEHALVNGYSAPYIFDNYLPFNYMFYFMFTLGKYFLSFISVPNSIILVSVQNGSNLYTGLFYPILEAGGNPLLLFFYSFIYFVFITFVIYSSIISYIRKINLISLSFYIAVISASTRFFMSPTFSYTEVPFSILIGSLLQIIYNFYGVFINKIKHINNNSSLEIVLGFKK